MSDLIPTSEFHRRPAHLILRAACIATIAAGGLVAGCERSNPSNDEALGSIASATAYRNAGGDAQGNPDGYVSAAQAATNAEASDAVQALAAELNADIAVERAQYLMGRRGTEEQDPGLVITQTDALSQAFNLAQLANTVALTQTFIEAEQQTNPEPTLGLISSTIEGMQGGESWSPAPSIEMQLAGIAATDEQISQVQSELQQLQQRAGELAEQRSQALSQASELDAEVGLQEPAQAEQTDQQILQLRNQAADLTAQATLTDAEIAQAEAQLAELQAYKQSIEQAVASLQNQSQTLEDSWTQISTQIQELENRKQQIYTGEAPSVTATGEALASTLERLAALEEEVLSLLDNAVGSYGEARSKATAAVSGREGGWSTAFQQAFSQNRNSLQLALTRRRQAAVHMGSAAVHMALLSAERTLQQGGQSLPGALEGDPSQAMADAVQQAATALVEAQGDAQNAAGGQGALAQAATLQEALILVDMMTLRQLVAEAGVEVELEIPVEAELQSQLQQVVSNARQEGLRLPPLPALVAAGANVPQPDAGGGLGGGLGGEPDETTQPADNAEADEAGEAGDDPDAAMDDPDADPDADPAQDPDLGPADPGLDPANNDDPALNPGGDGALDPGDPA